MKKDELRDMVSLALGDFAEALKQADSSINLVDIKIEVRSTPDIKSCSLPEGKMAVYAFFLDGVCLKCGKVGAKSAARYQSQHYRPNSSRSNLAKSLIKDKVMLPELFANEKMSGRGYEAILIV